MGELRSHGGLYFEDYEIGDSVTTQGRTITEADIVNFAALSGDWNPIHVDAEYAKGGMFGERIAHGLLGLSVATGLAARLGFINETADRVHGAGVEVPRRDQDRGHDPMRAEDRGEESHAAARAAGWSLSTWRSSTSAGDRCERGRGRCW